MLYWTLRKIETPAKAERFRWKSVFAHLATVDCHARSVTLVTDVQEVASTLEPVNGAIALAIRQTVTRQRECARIASIIQPVIAVTSVHLVSMAMQCKEQEATVNLVPVLSHQLLISLAKSVT